MSKIICLIVWGFILLLGVGPTFAAKNYTTAQDLVTRCQDVVKILDTNAKMNKNAAWCYGFITGFDQSHTAISFLIAKRQNVKNPDMQSHGVLYCPPKSVHFNQAIRVLVSYIKEHPKQKEMPAGLVAWYAFAKTYPCSKRQ